MNLPLMALLLILLLLIWLLIRRRAVTKSKKSAPALKSRSTNTTYHAVSIKFSSNACKAAKDMEGRRFLSSAAPRLPLPECEMLDCSCRFVHHKDRRASRDRRSPFGPSGYSGGTGSYDKEMREGKDRRRNDDEDLY